jgi:lipopolysaccharide/colanic/teichoic acid biosynthesis glycosyltransferase
MVRPSRRAFYPLAKRIIDILVSALVLILAAPLMAAIAVAIKLDSPGPVFHVQNRTGKDGRTFRFYKFRSMTNGVDHTQEHRKFAEAYINGQPVSASRDESGRVMYKPASNGHKITRVGRWLRQTSLDELPQIVNVLKGDMSLVGPRPTMDYETALYTDRHRMRLAATPGLTGWAQIHGRSGLSFDEIVSLDLEYIERSSLILDLKVMCATIPVVLNAEHAG